MKITSPIYQLKRHAKELARTNKTKLSLELDNVAIGEGFRNWGHLSSSYAKISIAQRIINLFTPGELAIIGARPGQGKTLLGLELVSMASHLNLRGHFYTLEYLEHDIYERCSNLGIVPIYKSGAIIIDTSDDICAEYIIGTVNSHLKPAFVVIDYMQLLDQNRKNPPLDKQVKHLKEFAKQTQSVVILNSQIDRSFELSDKDMPGVEDIRLPNQIDLSIIDKMCFLHEGQFKVTEMAAT